jgi:hypothetical protein
VRNPGELHTLEFLRKLAGDLHFAENWALEPLSIEYRASGTPRMAMAPGAQGRGLLETKERTGIAEGEDC